MIEHGLKKLARFEEQRPFLMIGIFILLTLFFATGFPLIQNEASFENFVPEDEPFILSLNQIRDNLGTGTSTITLIFQIDPIDPLAAEDIRQRDVLQAMDTILQLAATNEYVIASQSPLDALPRPLPPQPEIDAALAGHAMVSDDYRIAIARLTIPDGLSQAQQLAVIDEMQTTIEISDTPRSLSVSLAGAIVQEQEITAIIGSSLGFVTSLGFLGVFAVLYIVFRRIRLMIIAIIPVVFGILWTNGALGLIGIPFSTALVGVFSMIIGLGIDFAIHIIHRFQEELNGTSIQNAIVASVSSVGRALTLTTITTVIGFLALLTATLPVLKDMAIALSLGVFFSFVAAIGLLPPVLILAERFSSRKKKPKANGKKSAKARTVKPATPARRSRTTRKRR